MMIWYVIVFTLFADLSTLKADDSVYRSIYSPLLLVENQNILFATTPMSSTMAKGGNLLFACLILPRLLARKSHYFGPFIKNSTMVMTVILLLQCGDVERNPGPFNGSSQPPSKRVCTAICMCSQCNGAERDYRTVDRHMKEVYIHAVSAYTSEFDNSHDLTHPPNAHSLSSVPDGDNIPGMSATADAHEQCSVVLNTEEQNHSTLVLSQRKIQEFIIGAVQLKLNHGLSISTTEDYLRNTASLLGNKLIPTKWNEVIRFLRSLGYVDPRHYKVCTAQDHSYLLKLGENECKVCHKQSANCVDYYVLGLNFRDWFLTTNQCDRLMAHWSDRDHWLNKGDDYQHPRQTELWHGDRFRNLSWFWDSNKHYILPDWCPFCHTVISSSTIQAAFEREEPITCPECVESFPAIPRRVAGDPRNQVVLIHEDGWNCFSTSQSSMAAITITHGCMCKSDRSNADYARVYSFIPTDQMPTDSPHKFDAFLKPLIDELEELFIEGEEVFFRKAIPGVCEENTCSTLRVLPLLLTADSKAHHEIGLTSAGGHKGCRRCQVGGVYVPERRHYYFGSFQMRFWTPSLPRTAAEDRINGKAADRATSATERKQICKEKGVTGESILYRLSDLCSFDPVQDLTIDAMHAILLNLVRTELAHLLADLGPNSSLEPTERDPANGGLVDRQSLASAIQKVEWTPELKDGRVPTFCKDGQKLNYWKAEEFSKFVLVAHVVLRKLIPRKAYECFCTLKEICDLVYSKRLRIQGWHREHHEYFKKLLWKHAILFENLYGLSACTENLEYSLHMTEDVKRHSLLDNYWCHLYERQVKYYKQQSSNMKSLCKTFADRANQLYFTETFLLSNANEDESPETQFQCLKTKPILLTASSVEEAIKLKQHALNHREDDESTANHLEVALKSGIFLGKTNYHYLSGQELEDVQHWLRSVSDDVNLSLVPTVCLSFSRILKVNDYDLGVVYRTNEHAIVTDAEDNSKEWLTKITHFLVCGPVNGSYYSFIKGTFYAAKTLRGVIETDAWTGLPKMIRKDYRRLCVYLLNLLDRKVMVYPADSSHSSFLVIDPDSPLTIKDINIPYYPKVDDVVRVKLNTRTLLVLAKDVDHGKQCFHGHELRQVRGYSDRFNILSRTTTFNCCDVLNVVTHRSIAGCVYIDSN